MIDLLDTTFIIPICIESQDRRNNCLTTIPYLAKHLYTNIIIYEYDTNSKFTEVFQTIKNKSPKNLTLNNLRHIFMQNKSNNNIFHRTKFLNEMLAMTTSQVVVNYDIDIILQVDTYKKSRDLIKAGYDLVYPYFRGNSQYQVNYGGRDKLKQSLLLDKLSNIDYKVHNSLYGHCQFFNTVSYKEGGMENEGFISYAPEDQERGYRFQKLGYKVMWSNDYVYHLEHSRGNNSSNKNPMMDKNNKLFEYIKGLNTEQLRNYYNNIDYIKKYGK